MSLSLKRRFLFSLVVLALVAGCAKRSPVERMEAIRAQYSASLNAFVVKVPESPPVLEPESVDGTGEPSAGEPSAGEPSADEASADEASAGNEAGTGDQVGDVDDELAAALAAESVTGPVESTIILDFVVRTDSAETLPGITIDVTMGNTAGEKQRWEVWVDSTTLAPRGPGMQLTHELEGVMYEEGDGFHVEIRHPIPEEERTTYREYADAG